MTELWNKGIRQIGLFAGDIGLCITLTEIGVLKNGLTPEEPKIEDETKSGGSSWREGQRALTHQLYAVWGAV